MQLIDINRLKSISADLRKDWLNESKPFRYIVFDGFLAEEMAQEVWENYPSIEDKSWKYTTYINQKNKFVMTHFENEIINKLFNELNSKEFLLLIEEVTQIKDLVSDEKLFGGGLHCSSSGAFLDVHVDFNIHPETKFHRRMNLLLYMNKEWKEDYNGYLELWDMSTKRRLEYIEPKFNRLVIFETNEISYHGHPRPLNTPDGIYRKSIATYYYTKERPEKEIASEHNTLYVNTEGSKGYVKNMVSGIRALIERINK